MLNTIQEIIGQVTIIQLVAGLGYFFGHLFLARDRYYGWLFRIVGGICWIIFLAQNGNYIFMAATIVVTLQMIYGAILWFTSSEKGKFHTYDVVFMSLAAITSLGVIVHLLWAREYLFISLMETTIVVLEITGTILLARKKIIGWYFYILMSILVTYLVIFVNPVPAIILGLLEFCLIFFDVQGILKMSSSQRFIPK